MRLSCENILNLDVELRERCCDSCHDDYDYYDFDLMEVDGFEGRVCCGIYREIERLGVERIKTLLEQKRFAEVHSSRQER